MFKLDDNFLTELGLGALPPVEKNKMLAHIYETLEMRVGMRLAEKMSNEQLDEFEAFINRNDEAGALKWLETNFPNYKQVVAEELEKLKSEIRQVAPQIVQQALAQAAQNPNPTAMPQPTQPMQPSSEPGANTFGAGSAQSAGLGSTAGQQPVINAQPAQPVTSMTPQPYPQQPMQPQPSQFQQQMPPQPSSEPGASTFGASSVQSASLGSTAGQQPPAPNPAPATQTFQQPPTPVAQPAPVNMQQAMQPPAPVPTPQFQPQPIQPPVASNPSAVPQAAPPMPSQAWQPSSESQTSTFGASTAQSAGLGSTAGQPQQPTE
jgi:hypothetical protein